MKSCWILLGIMPESESEYKSKMDNAIPITTFRLHNVIEKYA